MKSDLRAGLTLSLLVLLISSGCATTRSYAPVDNGLNARVSALESQLADKNQEISGLRGEIASQQSSLDRADSENRILSEKLNAAISRLDAATRTPVSPKSDNQYLK